MDRIGANFEGAIAAMRHRLGSRAIALQLPIGEEQDFRGVIDLVERRAYIYVDKPGVAQGANARFAKFLFLLRWNWKSLLRRQNYWTHYAMPTMILPCFI